MHTSIVKLDKWAMIEYWVHLINSHGNPQWHSPNTKSICPFVGPMLRVNSYPLDHSGFEGPQRKPKGNRFMPAMVAHTNRKTKGTVHQYVCVNSYGHLLVVNGYIRGFYILYVVFSWYVLKLVFPARFCCWISTTPVVSSFPMTIGNTLISSSRFRPILLRNLAENAIIENVPIKLGLQVSCGKLFR